MAIVVVETLATEPLTPETLTETDRRVLGCLAERAATWRYSLLFRDRLRMLCTFEAPDAESVRAAYRKGGGLFNRIWSGERLTPDGDQLPWDETRLCVIEGTYAPLGEAELHDLSHKTLSCYTERGIEWIQSYLSRDRTRLICEPNAPDTESIRAAQHRIGIPCDRIWPARLIKP